MNKRQKRKALKRIAGMTLKQVDDLEANDPSPEDRWAINMHRRAMTDFDVFREMLDIMEGKPKQPVEIHLHYVPADSITNGSDGEADV